MNKILFDLAATQPSVSGKRHGGGIYGEKIFEKLVDLNAHVVGYYDSTKWLNPNIMEKALANNIELVDITKEQLNSAMERIKPDTIFSCLPESYHLVPGIRAIGVIHGLRHLELPHDLYKTRYPNISLKQKFKYYIEGLFPTFVQNYNKKRFYEYILQMDFITVSNHTAFSVKSFFPEYADKDIKVFYSPSTELPLSSNTHRVANYDYFLMVSGNRWEKNTLRAIQAFEMLFDRGLLPDIKIHITGLNDIKDIKYKYRHPDRFVALGYVDDDELQRQYRDAYAFIYPSLNEGFGYPPLEAMRFGVPVAASAVCSIPEVCGDAVLYFNPMDINEIKNRILQLTDNEIRQELKNKGLNRYSFIKHMQDADLTSLAKYIIS